LVSQDGIAHKIAQILGRIALPLGSVLMGGIYMRNFRRLWSDESGQDIAEYAVMLAVILVIVVGTVRLIGSNANNIFSSVASSIQ
jgi:Flp pilus assembly pilin Flp